MSSRRRTIVERDQAASSFSGILMALCEGSGALGAALVDRVGETVDSAGYVDPYALKVAAAEWRILLELARAITHPWYVATEALLMRGRKKSYAVAALPNGYALVLELPRRSFNFSRRALVEAMRAIELEAGLSGPSAGRPPERWFRVEVRTSTSDRRRPEAVWRLGSWCPILVLGRHSRSSSTPREAAFRARFPTGMEFNLVREPRGHWFADTL